jgi:3D (Asp-Asp-Asp) domain-containing protein
MFIVTAYAVGCDVVHGNPTRSGTQPVVEFTVAADPTVLPIGSIIEIEGLGERMVHDVGGKVKGRHVDVFVGGCREARRWGRRDRTVRVLHIPGRRVRQVAPVIVR